ncbi:MAG: transcription elongation factor GreA, partial [Pseudomonadota bacterium]|nr:transcription elongation factor GreA [Pseudomonadota bacterium]
MCSMAKVPFTPDGYKKLKEELNQLKTVERQQIIRDISEARDHGDLSENAEYDAAKNRQSFVEGRINYLGDRLTRAEVIDPTQHANLDQVVFGVFVTLADEDSGDETTYQLVGEDEADVEQGRLSIAAPLARALLGKEIDDDISLQLPAGQKEYIILDISATAP